MKQESENDKNKRIHEFQELQMLLSYLKVDKREVIYRHPLPIDFEITLDNKRIGIELTEIRPYTKQNKHSKLAVEKIVKEAFLENFDTDVSFLVVNITLTAKAYKMGVNLDILHKEIYNWKAGIENITNEYIDCVSVEEIPEIIIPKNKVYFNFQYEGFLQKTPTEYINFAHTRKNKKIDSYNKFKKPTDINGLDEIWLCITLPPDEKGYKIPAITLKSSKFDRVYLTQSYPWPNVQEIYRNPF